jgi:prepilin-type processing-associated H-X9-DG protein
LELITDATISRPGANGKPVFTGVSGGWPGHRSNHLQTKSPNLAAGTNILFLDGRVEWRPWSENGAMKIRLNGPDQWF